MTIWSLIRDLKNDPKKIILSMFLGIRTALVPVSNGRLRSLRSGVREGMEFQEAHSVTQIDRLDVEQGSVMSR